MSSLCWSFNEARALQYGKLSLYTFDMLCLLFLVLYFQNFITLAQLIMVKGLVESMSLWYATLYFSCTNGLSSLRSDPLYIQACY
ncbi:hypothetical protein BO85DRAFT_26623 [Aspergillus piperis CBS 112811]|uniref:Uncharacterized protein n=1 Tax=Aspergillus piperis CBS 112811 TaxID=1448313 RepID=A0A8G1VRZ4_9EURO|nr:hypothetical protein BO85DRAFT_26623 [Aspergillus piperis CBS 112811]RAH63604.1 hypothetical protein BO85DRAFT_26623 [Aspergillus piperis CBS 112811]